MQLAPAKKLPPAFQQRTGIALLPIRCKSAVLGRYGKPGPFRAAETGMGRICLPRHWRAGAIAAAELRPECDAVGVSQVIEGELGLRKAQLLALIDAGAAGQAEQQR